MVCLTNVGSCPTVFLDPGKYRLSKCFTLGLNISTSQLFKRGIKVEVAVGEDGTEWIENNPYREKTWKVAFRLRSCLQMYKYPNAMKVVYSLNISPVLQCSAGARQAGQAGQARLSAARGPRAWLSCCQTKGQSYKLISDSIKMLELDFILQDLTFDHELIRKI